MQMMTLKKMLSQAVNGFSVFVCALVVRLVFALTIAPRQLCGLNDRPVLDLAFSLSNAFNSGTLGMSATHDLFERGTIIDSLIQRGPVYPTFLAVLHRLFAISPRADLTNLDCTNFVIVNCIVSALACLGIYYAARLAYNRRAAQVASILAILYPASIVNTLHCYPEFLCYTLVSLFLTLLAAVLIRHRIQMLDVPLFFCLGLVAGLIMFCLPILFGMPVLIACALLGYKFAEPLARLSATQPLPEGATTAGSTADAGPVSDSAKVATSLVSYAAFTISALAGLAFVMAPWIRLQQICAQRFELLSLATFSSPLWVGNLLSSSGWEALPVSDFLAANLPGTARILLKSIVLAPVPHFFLLMEKIPRLWAGNWNDFGYSTFGITDGAANIFHCLLLAAAYLGFSLSTLSYPRWKLSRSLPCSAGFGIVIVYHFLYCILSPVSRDCYTAMPAVILLAAFAIDRLLSFPAASKRTAAILLCLAVALFGYLSSDNLVSLLYQGTHSEVISKICFGVVALLGWFFLFALGLRLVENQSEAKVSSASDMLKLACFGVAIVTISCSITNQRWREWSSVLTVNHRDIVQYAVLPPLAQLPALASRQESTGTATAFVLIDACSSSSAPQITASVNGIAAMAPPISWLQVRPLSLDGFSDVASQAKGMGCDWRSLRQWWAVPVPLLALRFGARNDIRISLQPVEDGSSCRIFGQYGEQSLNGAGSVTIMPSPYTVSWQKGFATYESGDMRVVEPVAMGGLVISPIAMASRSQPAADGSGSRGKIRTADVLTQSAFLRVRLAIPVRIGFATVTGWQAESTPGTVQLPQPFKRDEMVVVSHDEKTQTLIPSLSSWSEALSRRSMLLFRCELKSLSKNTTGCLSLKITGTNSEGRQTSYVSPWQPASFQVSDRWQSFSWLDIVPDDVAPLKSVEVSVSLRPYDTAEALAHPDEVKTKQISVRHISLSALPPLDVPAERDRDWIIF
jgi:hypothetical protein